MDVPISELTFRNDVSNVRSNFPIQFFSAFRCRGALGKIGSRNWIGNWKRHFGRLIQKLERPIRRSNFTIQFFVPGQPGGWLGRQLTVFDHLATAAHSWPSRRLPGLAGRLAGWPAGGGPCWPGVPLVGRVSPSLAGWLAGREIGS